ncbi:hypothetical protein B0I35DRAFT_440318 [Stachybotrys elegans]|uniref:Secreted protein n=1 Tax=Stachybotrys elegans TaxID=80388 RepID=A0A8K0WLT3_9HYPO|nr:hypothetical protein B0I35DRAFT_440318 [Stachybotrys elegans]
MPCPIFTCFLSLLLLLLPSKAASVCLTLQLAGQSLRLQPTTLKPRPPAFSSLLHLFCCCITSACVIALPW